MNIALIYGGKSGEHEVSLVSGASIARHIPGGHRIILIGITKDGAWYLQDEDTLNQVRATPSMAIPIAQKEDMRVSLFPGGGPARALSAGGKNIPVDVVFPVLHGTFGEDGTIQGLLEMADLPYVGGGVLASSVSMDKEKTKILWQAAGLPVVPFVAVKRFEWDDESKRKTIIAKAEHDLGWPLFVKPACAGSSVGAAKASNREELEKRSAEAFMWDHKILIEPFIPAREIECSVTGNDQPTAYTPGEIIPSHEFYDYDAKYTDPNGASMRIPADISDDTTKIIRRTAIEAYRALDLSGLSRVDFFLDKRNDRLYLNEINTLPGFTSISMFPKMCEASGLPYGDLVMKLLNLAIERFTSNRSLKTSRL
jgi:D-alanine-D-alanine ligase